MNTLREWAEFYQDKKVWVFPYNHPDNEWKFWRNKKDQDYLSISKDYCWENATGIKIVVGKKGIRVFEFHKERDKATTSILLAKVLKLLVLPEDYTWIIESNKTLAIIVDTLSDTVGMHNLTGKKLLLLVEGSYVIPPSNSSKWFYENRLPDKHPTQISNKVLFQCYHTIRESMSTAKISFEENIEEQKKERVSIWQTVMYKIKGVLCKIIATLLRK